MKVWYLIVIVFIALGCHNRKNQLIERNNEVVHDVNTFYVIHDSLFTLLAADTNPQVCIQHYEKLLQIIQHFRLKYEQMIPLKESTIEEIAMQFFQKYDTLVRSDYKTLINHLTKPMYEFNRIDIQHIDSLYRRIDSIQNAIDEFLKIQQKIFLEKFQLQEI